MQLIFVYEVTSYL